MMCIDWLTEITVEAGLDRHPLGGAVPGAGLLGRIVGSGMRCTPRADDPGAVVGETMTAPSILASSRSLVADRATSRAKPPVHSDLDDRVVAQDDQRAGAPGEDPLESVAQRGSRCDAAEEVPPTRPRGPQRGHERS